MLKWGVVFALLIIFIFWNRPASAHPTIFLPCVQNLVRLKFFVVVSYRTWKFGKWIAFWAILANFLLRMRVIGHISTPGLKFVHRSAFSIVDFLQNYVTVWQLDHVTVFGYFIFIFISPYRLHYIRRANFYCLCAYFSERELMFTFAICRRPSVCLSSVCRLSSVTFVHPTQAIEIFGNVSKPLVLWPSVTLR